MWSSRRSSEVLRELIDVSMALGSLVVTKGVLGAFCGIFSDSGAHTGLIVLATLQRILFVVVVVVVVVVVETGTL